MRAADFKVGWHFRSRFYACAKGLRLAKRQENDAEFPIFAGTWRRRVRQSNKDEAESFKPWKPNLQASCGVNFGGSRHWRMPARQFWRNFTTLRSFPSASPPGSYGQRLAKTTAVTLSATSFICAASSLPSDLSPPIALCKRPRRFQTAAP